MVKEFCEIQMQLKNYKKALAFAPGVSIEYWQELAERHAHILNQEGKEDAAIASIVCDKLDDAVGIFQNREEFEDGKLVRALHLTGGFTSVLNKTKLRDDLPQQPSIEEVSARLAQMKLDNPDLLRFADKQAKDYFKKGQAFRAAASYLAVNDVKSAIQIFVRTNELFMAYHLAKQFCKPAVQEIAILLA